MTFCFYCLGGCSRNFERSFYNFSFLRRMGSNETADKCSAPKQLFAGIGHSCKFKTLQIHQNSTQTKILAPKNKKKDPFIKYFFLMI